MSPREESATRLACFVGVLLLMALWELLAPRRPPAHARRRRWPSNLGIVVLNTLAVRVVWPMGAVGVALFAEERRWGLLQNWAVPPWLATGITIVILDLVLYLQHVMFHAVPLLWRLHRMHHADLEFDATTGVRFHPLEVLLSMGIKGAAVLLLGPPALGVLLFEVLLNATALFSHGNVRLPAAADGIIRWLTVTPDMHRVHHSAVAAETNSNFGFNLSLWDRLFGTYRAQPAAGHEGMTIGLPQYRDAHALRLDWMLALPFLQTVPEENGVTRSAATPPRPARSTPQS